MTITNGTVCYERNVRPADFESKKASVTLSFAVAEDSDPAPVVTKVMDLAVSEVHRRLGIAVPAGQQPAPVMEADKGKRIQRAKVPPAEVPAGNASSPHGSIATAFTPAVADDPAAIGDPEAGILELTKEQEVPVVTDKQLRDAVNYAVGEKKVATKAIVDLISEFNDRVPGKNIPAIAQDRRSDFLARLKALYNA